MKTMLTLVRMAVLATAGLTAVAIGIGLAMDEPETLRVAEHRTLMHVPRDQLAATLDGASWFVDPALGRLEPLRLPKGDHLDLATAAPWRDAQGRRYVLGRWTNRIFDEKGTLDSKGSGLALFSFPDGAPLDYVPMNITPSCPPAWAPGTEARVLFTGGDGVIYSVSFEHGDPSHPARQPVPLTPALGMPWGVGVHFGNLCWPDDIRFNGRVLVSLRHRNTPDRGFAPPEIWWLKLDGLRIVDAGRVTEDDPEIVNEQFPTVATGPDGALRLAFLTGTDERDWRLAVAPLDFDATTGHPMAGRPEMVAENCYFSRPAFSADGSWLSCVVRGAQTELLPHRVALDDVLVPSNAYAAQATEPAPSL